MPEENLEKFNEDIAHQLRNSIIAEGWPCVEVSMGTNYLNKIKDVNSKYEALGEILKSQPSIFFNDWSFLEFLFDSLGNKSITRIDPSIQQALSGLTVHLSSLSDSRKIELKSLLRKYITIDSAKYIVVKYVNSTYPFQDQRQGICLFWVHQNPCSHTIEEGLNGLHPYWFNINQAGNTTEFKSTSYLLGQESSVEFPSFDFIATLLTEIENAKTSHDNAIFVAS